MTDEIIEKDLRCIVAKLMKKKSIENYAVHIDGQSKSGENYMGEIIFFRVIEDNGKVENFVMKTAKRAIELRKACPVELIYQRELFLYSDVFPTFKNFVSEKQTDFKFDFVPKVYWIENEVMKESLIFGNLKTEGYQLWDRSKPWNLEHSLMAMKYYGKFHAISMAISDQKPEIFDDWKRNMKNVYEESAKVMDIKEFYRGPVEDALKILEAHKAQHLIDKYGNLVDEITTIMNYETCDEDRLVLIHGDCWNNNFMFKYEDTGSTRPSKMCFLDFQLSYIDTPLKDLVYNIYSTCDHECLKHFDQLLETYYDSLSQNFRLLGSDPKKLFTYDQLRQNFKKYGKFGLLLSTILIKIELIDKAEPPDINKFDKSKEFSEFFNFEVENKAEYDRRIFDVFKHYGETFL